MEDAVHAMGPVFEEAMQIMRISLLDVVPHAPGDPRLSMPRNSIAWAIKEAAMQ
jgi:hypothetical protein